jgi:Zn-dependent M28 family amino/carboxypeptidase
MKVVFSLTVFATFFLACSSGINTSKIASVQENSLNFLRTNLEFLASDELEGREATKNGARTAALFLASRLKQMGIKPYGDDSTYFQNFNLQSTRFLEDSKLNFDLKDKISELTFGETFLPISIGEATDSSELIFVRYGITDTVTGYDDYKDLDVSGKTIICLSGTPEDSIYDKMNRRRMGRSTVKAAMAAEHGADGAIIIVGEPWIHRWERLKGWATGEDIGEIEENNDDEINAAWIDSTTVKSLFTAPDSSYLGLFHALENGIIKTGTNLAATASWDIRKEQKIIKARNVVGLIEGTDPALADELVTLGAHYDHVGMRDTIVYNGANDNGSGTVAVLEIARRLSALKLNQRPVLILFYTAEEKGLIGSEYFTDNFDRMDDVLVNINLDMVGRGAPDTLFVIGSGRISSEFFHIVENANKAKANFVYDYKLDAKNDPERIYYRSDSYSFARKDIPTVFLTDNEEKDYHRPTDDWEKIDFRKLNKVTNLTENIILQVANLEHRLIIDHADIVGPVNGGSSDDSTMQNPVAAPKTEKDTQSKK